MDNKFWASMACLLAFMEDAEETNWDGVSVDLKELDSLYPYPPLEELVKEREELRKKYAAINRFINCIADPDKIAYSEMKILEKQREVIGEYISILDTRLKKAGVKDD